jgi:hypothetical protein
MRVARRAISQKVELTGQPFYRCRLYQDGHENGNVLSATLGRARLRKSLFELDQTHVQHSLYFITIDGRAFDELLSGNFLQESA